MNHSQKKGLVAIVALLVIVIAFKVLPNWMTTAENPIQSSQADNTEVVNQNLPDLNTLGLDELVAIPGIGDKLADRIIRYRELIGGYSNVRQLAGIQGMTAENLLLLEEKVMADTTTEAYRLLALGAPKKSAHFFKSTESRNYAGNTNNNVDHNENHPPKFEEHKSQHDQYESNTDLPAQLEAKPAPTVNLDLNLADSAQLTTIKGIGAKTASAIIKYRDRLGYFTSVDQLLEIKIIFPDNFERMKGHLYIDNQDVETRRTKINQVELEVLARHPYVGWKDAKLVIAYREAHGRFGGFEDLENIREIDLDKWRNMKQYLDFS